MTSLRLVRRRENDGQPIRTATKRLKELVALLTGDRGRRRRRTLAAVDHAPRLPLTGGCGCGAVRFEVTAPLVSANYCHCTRCQRRSGTAASANARPAPGSFRLIAGEDTLRSWRPEGGFEKWFCGECGSAVFSRSPDDPDRMSIRLGAFDSDPGIRPSVRQFTAYAASWEAIPDDELPRHAESARID